MTSTATAPPAPSLGGWDRLAMALLGGAAFAQSFDALRQMAAAMHVRSQLTWLFPLLVDGFIAYGIRALLVVRNSRLRARAYVWLLVGGATVTSIWANALHAVRLNQQHDANPHLRLGDIAVALLSTVAPIAIAGAVHLYILVTREMAATTGKVACTTPSALSRQPPDAVRTGAPTEASPPPRPPDADADPTDGLSVLRPSAAGLLRNPSPDAAVTESGDTPRKAESPPDSPGGHVPVTGSEPGAVLTPPPPEQPPKATGSPEVRRFAPLVAAAVNGPSEAIRQVPTDADRLLTIARAVPLHRGRPSRQAVAATIRRQGLTVSNGRLNELMAVLRSER